MNNTLYYLIGIAGLFCSCTENSHTASNKVATKKDSTTIQTTIGGGDIDKATLYYKIGKSGSVVSVNMENTSDSLYSAIVEAPPKDSAEYYYIETVNKQGKVSRHHQYVLTNMRTPGGAIAITQDTTQEVPRDTVAAELLM